MTASDIFAIYFAVAVWALTLFWIVSAVRDIFDRLDHIDAAVWDTLKAVDPNNIRLNCLRPIEDDEQRDAEARR